ncbi:MAG TPA: DMT family transporter [Blastocatellia bacterium]|nr:DMT family transporter [Blastocatellia bacterium]
MFLLIALIAGAFIPVQTGVNSQLSRWVGHPVLASLVSFLVGTAALLAYTLTLRIPLPAPNSLNQSPWWVWTGGLLGAFFVTASIIVAPRLGAAITVALIIAGQLLVALALDHFGLLGFPERPLNGWRVLGAILLVIGVALIRRF